MVPLPVGTHVASVMVVAARVGNRFAHVFRVAFKLFEALRALRKEVAEKAQVPPYVVFHDSTLREMTSARPETLAQLGRLPGIGAKKLEAYGEQFLRAIQRH